MKFLLITLCVSVIAADVVVNQINVEEPKGDAVRQEIPVIDVTLPPPKTCKNVTVSTRDCTSVIVTRLPFLFNFMNLDKVCDCEDGQLKCDRGVGANIIQRFQIPGLRVVYNSNCKCKCQAPVEVPVVEETTPVVVV